jgi:hypothetical protein
MIHAIEQHNKIKALHVGLVLGKPCLLIVLCDDDKAYFINGSEATSHSSFTAAKSAARRFAERYIQVVK